MLDCATLKSDGLFIAVHAFHLPFYDWNHGWFMDIKFQEVVICKIVIICMLSP